MGFTFRNLKRAILLEAAFTKFWAQAPNIHVNESNGWAESYRHAFVDQAACERAVDELSGDIKAIYRVRNFHGTGMYTG